MILYDATHTSRTAAQTGVQRVTRRLLQALEEQGAQVRTVAMDRIWARWRGSTPVEERCLRPDPRQSPGRTRGMQRRWLELLPASCARWLAHQPPPPDWAGAVAWISPEIFSPAAARIPGPAEGLRGPRLAVFHDALAVDHPDWFPPAVSARFPAYLRELRSFDGIVAGSASTARDLLRHWAGDPGPRPPVRVAPFGAGLRPAAPPPPAPTAGADGPELLCIGTLETRKNHLALLRAAERLWAAGRRFRLRLIGLEHAQTGGEAAAAIRRLRAAGQPLRWDGPASDADLADAYARCALVVYPSLAEGFGLPVLEALAFGRPCACRWTGALGESASGGGCIDLGDASADAIAAALSPYLETPRRLDPLADAARARQVPGWEGAARVVLDWIADLRSSRA